jgi:hypothetical protein
MIDPGKTNRCIRKRSDQRFDTLDPDKQCQGLDSVDIAFPVQTFEPA